MRALQKKQSEKFNEGKNKMLLKKFREKQGYSLKAFAELLCVEEELVFLLESTKFDCFIKGLIKIADTIGFDLHILFAKRIRDRVANIEFDIFDIDDFQKKLFFYVDREINRFDTRYQNYLDFENDLLLETNYFENIRDNKYFYKEYYSNLFLLARIAYTFDLFIDDIFDRKSVSLLETPYKPSYLYANKENEISTAEGDLLNNYRKLSSNGKWVLRLTAKNLS